MPFSTLYSFPRFNFRRISYLLLRLLPNKIFDPFLPLLLCIQRVFPSPLQVVYTHKEISNFPNVGQFAFTLCIAHGQRGTSTADGVQCTIIHLFNWSSGKGKNYHRIHPQLLHCWARTKLVGMIWTKPGCEESYSAYRLQCHRI